MIASMIIVLTALILLTQGVEALKPAKQRAFQNLVYPWPTRPDWPMIKMSYNYILSGDIKG